MQIDTHPKEIEDLDDDIEMGFGINSNMSENNNSKDAVDTAQPGGSKQVDQFHSITTLVTHDSSTKVIPETPKPQRKPKPKTLMDFKFSNVRSSKSEGNLNDDNNVSIEMSEVNPGLWGEEIRRDGAPSTSTVDFLNTVINNAQQTGNPNEKRNAATSMSKENTPRRFDKNIQTSKNLVHEEPQNVMQKFHNFVNGMVLDIKRSSFVLPNPVPQNSGIGNIHTLTTLSRNLPTTSTPSVTQRVDVKIFEPAKSTWRTLRQLQAHKVEFELHIAYNQKLLDSDHFPDWVVNFTPPENLLSSMRAIESTVGFRYEQAKQTIGMLIDLMKEESNRLSNEIQATMAALECHYQHEDASGYNIADAMEALTTFIQRTKDNEERELARRYSSIHTAP